MVAHGMQPPRSYLFSHFIFCQAQDCKQLLLSLSRSDAVSLARRRNLANLSPAELLLSNGVNTGVDPAFVQDLLRHLHQLCADESMTSSGRGGAVRRRKGSDSATQSVTMEVCEGLNTKDDSKVAAAAGDLLQFAAGTLAAPSGRSRNTGPSASRQRDAKPYQRRTGRAGKGGREDSQAANDRDCWLPGGFWWQDHRTPMPSGRQPGELAGWTPLAGEIHQQRDQEHREALSHKEHFVQVRAFARHSPGMTFHFTPTSRVSFHVIGIGKP